MFHPALFLLLVCTAAVSTHYNPANAAPEQSPLSAGLLLPSERLPDLQRLWRRLEEVQRPAAAPEGISRPWRIGRPARLSSSDASWRSDADSVLAEPIAARPTRNEPSQEARERAVHMCGSPLVDFIERLCHTRRRRDAGVSDVHHLRSALLQKREAIVEVCCHRPCTPSELMAFVSPTCDISLTDFLRNLAFFSGPVAISVQRTSPVRPAASPTTARPRVGPPPVHTPISQDNGYLEDGFQKRDMQPSRLTWETDRQLHSPVSLAFD